MFKIKCETFKKFLISDLFRTHLRALGKEKEVLSQQFENHWYGKKNSGLETRFKNRKIKPKSAGPVSEKKTEGSD